MKKQARSLAKAGRYGDDSIVHMSRREIAALEGIASLAGRRLTKNPKTGATEAFNLFDILPLALNFIAPGMGTAAQMAIAAASGAASAGMSGRDPLTGALLGGITSGIAGNLFGGSPGEEALKAINAGDMSKLSPDALKTVAQGPLGPGVMESALPEKYMTDLFGAGSDAAIDSTVGSLLSKQNLPLTLMGASMLAPMFDQPTDGSSVRPDYSPNLRGPAPSRQYTPFSGDYSTYGQTGGEAMQVYQPGRLGQSYQYTGDPYEGDPRDYGFRVGGFVGRNRDKKEPMAYVPPLVIPRTPGQPGMVSQAPNFSGPQAPVQAQQGGKANNPFVSAMGIPTRNKGNPANVTQQLAQVQPPRQVPVTQNPNLVAGSMGGGAGTYTPPTTYAPPGGVLSGKSADVPQINPGTEQAYQDFASQRGMDRSNIGYLQNAMQSPMVPAFAKGGIAGLPGKVNPEITRAAMKSKKKYNDPRFIGGDDKGMDDTIPAKIDGKTPAKLSSGEFVIPADIVSMLGDGNTAAGVRALREMMQRVRMQKTGNGNQAQPLNEMDVMPA